MGDLSKVSGRVEWHNAENIDILLEDAEVESMVMAGRSGHGRPVELAITGRAFNSLLMTGKMRDLLFGG